MKNFQITSSKNKEIEDSFTKDKLLLNKIFTFLKSYDPEKQAVLESKSNNFNILKQNKGLQKEQKIKVKGFLAFTASLFRAFKRLS